MLWGLLHGLLLAIEALMRTLPIKRPPDLALALLTFVLVSLCWIPFRSADLSVTVEIVKAMFVPAQGLAESYTLQQLVAAVGIVAVVVYHYWRRHLSLDDLLRKVPPAVQAGLLAIAIAAIALTATGDSHAFIYFQF